jgi:hypothetical protein
VLFRSDGSTVSGSVPIFGQTGGGTAYTTGSFGTALGPAGFSATTYSTPTFGQVGAIPVSHTYYTRNLIFRIYDEKKTVLEGRVTSTGSSSQISQVMPNMISALFKDFPGINGKTIEVEEPLINK